MGANVVNYTMSSGCLGHRCLIYGVTVVPLTGIMSSEVVFTPRLSATRRKSSSRYVTYSEPSGADGCTWRRISTEGVNETCHISRKAAVRWAAEPQHQRSQAVMNMDVRREDDQTFIVSIPRHAPMKSGENNRSPIKIEGGEDSEANGPVEAHDSHRTYDS